VNKIWNGKEVKRKLSAFGLGSLKDITFAVDIVAEHLSL
jgi:hypothetical protein